MKVSDVQTKSTRKLYIILERANLEIVRADNHNGQAKHELLNCDEHMFQIRKLKKDPAFCRPDIVHQCLQVLSESPLNRAGLLQVYVKSQNNHLIRIDPQLSIPHSFSRFTKIIVHLLEKLKPVRAQGSSKQLAKLLKNPVTLHLPIGCAIYGTSSKSEKLIRPEELVPKDREESVAIVIGAMAHESVQPDYVNETFSISKYPLSAALVCAKITNAFEELWDIR